MTMIERQLDDEGNTVSCDFDPNELLNFRLTIKGCNNSIVFKSRPLLHGNLVIYINADNCEVVLGENITCQKNLFISLLPSGKGRHSRQLKCSIGNNTTFNGLVSIVLAEENNEIQIGENCLFADNISISTSDSHRIFSIKTGDRINKAQSVFIGHHVWVGENVKILKGSMILNDSIVAMGSIVTRKFEYGNVVLAGVPAKIVRSEVNWDY